MFHAPTLRKERDKNFQAAERFRRPKENDIPWRGVRRRPQKISPGESRDSEGTRRFLPWREPHVCGDPDAAYGLKRGPLRAIGRNVQNFQTSSGAPR